MAAPAGARTRGDISIDLWHKNLVCSHLTETALRIELKRRVLYHRSTVVSRIAGNIYTQKEGTKIVYIHFGS